MPGSYRAGFWYDPRYKREFKHTPDGEPVDEFRGDDVGFYLGADQMVWKENDDPADTQGLGLFCRYGYAHRDINRVSDYWQAGASYKGLLPERNNDVFGFSVAQAILSSQYRHNVHAGADRETVYEWYYQIQLTPWCTISPDLQVVTNPGGDKDDRDAVVGGLRIRIIF
jgi:porin